MNFSTEYASDIGRVLAFTTLSMVPALLFYVIAERQLVGGLTTGAVKG
jgi:raffinose/stachyose/melibiose transport system permease protein